MNKLASIGDFLKIWKKTHMSKGGISEESSLVLAPVSPQKQGQMEESLEYTSEEFVPPDVGELLVRDLR